MDKMEVDIATNSSLAESNEDVKIIFETPKVSQRPAPSFEGRNDKDISDSDAEEIDNFNLSGISDDDFDLKISTTEVDIATNSSLAESNEDVKIIFETPKVSQRPAPSFEGRNDKDISDSDAEEIDNFNLSGISDDDFDLKISTKGDIAINPSPAESKEDVEIIFETQILDSDAEEIDNFNLSGISDDDFDLKISSKDKKGNSANPNFPTKIIHKPKKNPQVLEQIKRECPRGEPIEAKPCKVHIPKRKAKLLKLLKRKCHRREPIVGLNEILEIEETSKGKGFSYDCLACRLHFSASEIIKHLISLKHRTEYLNVIDYPGLEVVYGDCPRVKKLVKKMCIEVQRCEGMGKPAVIKEKGMSGQAEKSGTSN